MKLSWNPTIAAALLFLLAGPATAQESPVAVYGKFHQAALKANYAEMKKHATAESMKVLETMPEDKRAGMLSFSAMLLPPKYTITGQEPSADGNRVTLRATGMLAVPGVKPELAIGELQMLKVGGAWKVASAGWQPADAGKPANTKR